MSTSTCCPFQNLQHVNVDRINYVLTLSSQHFSLGPFKNHSLTSARKMFPTVRGILGAV